MSVQKFLGLIAAMAVSLFVDDCRAEYSIESSGSRPLVPIVSPLGVSTPIMTSTPIFVSTRSCTNVQAGLQRLVRNVQQSLDSLAEAVRVESQLPGPPCSYFALSDLQDVAERQLPVGERRRDRRQRLGQRQREPTAAELAHQSCLLLDEDLARAHRLALRPCHRREFYA